MNERLVTKKFLEDLLLPLKDSDYALDDWVGAVESFDNEIFICSLSKGYKHGGPYIVMWSTDCGRLMSWTTTDSTITDVCYRTAPHGMMEDESLSSETFRSAFVDRYKEASPEFYLLPKNERVRGCLRDELVLDSDLFRGSKSDNEISHQRLSNLIKEYGIKLVAETSAAAVETEKDTEMTTTSATTQTKISSIVDRYKTAGTNAVQYQAGKALNVALVKAVRPHLPMMVRGYADHAAFSPVLAMGLSLATEFLPEGEVKNKAAKAADLMLSAAFLDGADKFFNVEEIMTKIMAGLPPEAREALES